MNPVENKGVEGGEAPAGENPAPKADEAQQASQNPAEPEKQGQGSQEQDDFPQDVEKQKEAFIKMRQTIAEQKKQLAGFSNSAEPNQQPTDDDGNILDDLRSPEQRFNQKPFDENTDINEFTQRMSRAERMAYEASQRNRELERRLEDEKLYSKFPELNPENPDSKKPENKNFEEVLAGQYLLRKMRGENVDIVKLAEDVKGRFSNLSEAQKEEAASQARAELEKKEQASSDPSQSSTQIQPTKGGDLESYRARARRGDTDAMAEVLKNTVLND